MAISKDLLLKPRLTEEDLEIPGVGTVRIRTMSREEMHRLNDKNDTARGERRVLAACLINPELTEAEAGEWQRAAGAGEITAVVEKIMRLSGLVDDAGKSDQDADRD